MYYLMLTFAAFLFSSQFLFNQKFEEQCGSSFTSTMIFSMYSSAAGFFILLIISGFKLTFSWFSVFIATLYAAINILYNIASVKSFEYVNLSAYSVFAMLGGMLLPSVYAIFFLHEPVNLLKILCYFMIISALFFNIDFSHKGRRKIYYIAVFILNGAVGIISVIHQNNTMYAADSFSFLMISRIISTLICIPFIVKSNSAFKNTPKKAIWYCVYFAAFCSIGNLMVLIALKHLQASVQYPIVTGGVMIMSLMISLLRKEKISYKNVISTAIAFLSTVLISIY